jgi:IS5 family transposase
MQPHIPVDSSPHDLFRSHLEQIINMQHELVKLSKAIDWDYLDKANAVFYAKDGRAGVKTRLIVGLHILKQMYNLSDESVCDRWINDPYFQYFCGEIYFQHVFPMERSSMTHWRKRVGEKYCETLVQESLRAAYQLGALRGKDLNKVVADTTVQPKVITFPTDAKLYYKALIALGKLAKKKGIQLRQSYIRVAKKLLVTSGRYQHAKQMRRATKTIKKLKTLLGRFIRDIERKTINDEELQQLFYLPLAKAQRILSQQRHYKNKLYSWHAPEVECIGKGKADKPYEFGCKVSLMTNLNSAPAGHFVIHAKAFHDNPYDGHTLNAVISDMSKTTGIEPERIYVDKGYRGHDYPYKFKVFKSGQKRGVTAANKKELRRRSVIEPVIGHMKNEGRLGRNYLKGILGDKLNVLLVAAGYNFKIILRWLRKIFCSILFMLFGSQLTNMPI